MALLAGKPAVRADVEPLRVQPPGRLSPPSAG